MAASKRGLVDKVKKVVAQASTRGAMTLVEGTAAAVRTVDKLQQKLASRRKQEDTDTSAEASKASAPEQAPAMKTQAPARAPKRPAAPRTPARAKAVEEAPAPRTSGRKTMAAEPAAAKRTKAPAQKKVPATGEFKVKRGQKHLHSGR